MHGWIVLILLLVTVAYAVIGGVMFHYIERPREKAEYTRTFQYQLDFLENYTCVSGEDLQKLIELVSESYSHGVMASTQKEEVPQWELVNSIFFSATVITTIGYGHLAPSTNLGRAVCVIYAMVGIPLTLLSLSLIGKKILGVYDYLIEHCSCVMCPAGKMGKVIRFITVFMIGCVTFVFVPAVAFSILEGWDYGTSLYFVIISLSTIGFGDVIIGNRVFESSLLRNVYRILVCVWIILGLAWFATCISAAQDLMEEEVEDLGKMAYRETSHQQDIEERENKNNKEMDQQQERSGEEGLLEQS